VVFWYIILSGKSKMPLISKLITTSARNTALKFNASILNSNILQLKNAEHQLIVGRPESFIQKITMRWISSSQYHSKYCR
jgi:hypothetical protein